MHDVERHLTECGVEFELTQPVGVDTAEELLKAMERDDAELLVIGIRHRSPVGKLLLGSVSQQLLLECPKPVLAVKPDERLTWPRSRLFRPRFVHRARAHGGRSERVLTFRTRRCNRCGMGSREPVLVKTLSRRPQHRALGRRGRRRLGEPAASEIAKRNLIWSIFAEHVGFSVWSIWSVMVLFMPQAIYHIDAAGKFYLVAVPTLVGAAMRIPYTIAPAKFGGRNWTIVSALLLLIPTVLTLWVMKRPDTSYTTFMIVAAFAGFGGGNFASSMTNINAFYPQRLKGWALGLNAGGGNIGVPVIQLVGLLVIATVSNTAPEIVCAIYLVADRARRARAPRCSWTTSATSGPTSARWPKRCGSSTPG